MPETPSAPPRGLAEAGSAFWAEVVGEFELTAVERHLMREACSTVDTIAALEDALAGDGDVLIEGSKGQDVLHPCIAELRQQRLALGRLLAQLKLPDESGGTLVATLTEARGRKAAEARWSRGA